MAKVKLFNSKPVGGPAIVLPVHGRADVVVPAEGDGEGNLIDEAVGVTVEADKARLEKQAVQVSGLVVM